MIATETLYSPLEKLVKRRTKAKSISRLSESFPHLVKDRTWCNLHNCFQKNLTQIQLVI